MALSTLFSIILQFVFFVIINKCNGTDIPKFPAVLVFGDSTSDTGNNNYIATLAKGNHYPYGKDFPGHVASGRFSNGKLVTDFMVSTLGIKDTVPPFLLQPNISDDEMFSNGKLVTDFMVSTLGIKDTVPPFLLQPNISDDEMRTGVSFASGGSGYDDLTASLSTVIPVSRQAVYFMSYIERLKSIVGEKEAQKIVNDALVSITAGTNDFVFNYYDIPSRRSQFTIDGYQNYILNRLHDFVKELYKLGCRQKVIAGLPPVGCLPLQMTAKFKNPFARTCVETQNSDARAYNKKLVKLLSQIEISLYETRIFYADIYQPAMELITNPQKHGLVETTKGCCGTGLYEAGPICRPLSPVCADSSKYLFFDSIHPGETAYRYVAECLENDMLQKLSTGGGR